MPARRRSGAIFATSSSGLVFALAGDGVISARTSCLGPCNLAPVVQVYPEGTYYCGVDEPGLDRIIGEHLLRGEIVENSAYAPREKKQRLRIAKPE